MEIEVAAPAESTGGINQLFNDAMRGQWEKVVDAYRKWPSIQEVPITRSKDTALHLAVADDNTSVAAQLVTIIKSTKGGAAAKSILGIKNETTGSTALHYAAALGNVGICRLIAEEYPDLIEIRNDEEATPLFWSVRFGKTAAYRFLGDHYKKNFGLDNYDVCRIGKTGRTILHAAIYAEHFRLAYQIIQDYPKLVDWRDLSGLTPLHVLAHKHQAFKSSTFLGPIERLIYYCTSVDETTTMANENNRNNSGNTTMAWPPNYETCVAFFRSLAESRDEENQQGIIGDKRLKRTDPPLVQRKKAYPPSYDTLALFVQFALHAFLVMFGFGYGRIQKIIDMKHQNFWATRTMDELVERDTLYKFYDNSGQKPNKSEGISISDIPPDEGNSHQEERPSTDKKTKISGQDTNSRDKQDTSSRTMIVASMTQATELVEKFLDMHPAALQVFNTSDKSLMLLTYDDKKPEGTKETPILIAAKMGVIEMVSKILDTYPVAIQDLDKDEKNVVLVAVENRQTEVFEYLLNRTQFKETVFRQLDKDENSAVHLAAKFGDSRPRSIPGFALQMQWESKWYEFVKESMQELHISARPNKLGQTASEIFTETHKDLMNKGSEWLTKTSESCSVVAALIATVAFATSVTVPGGTNEKTGRPTLQNHPAFDVFTVSSLVALCFSVTALVFFLAILTSRSREKDFLVSLPRTLLLGLTSLFVSIASILVSFCAGHFFVLSDKLVGYAVFPIYTVTCLPVTFFGVAQLPLYFDLLSAIFMDKPQRAYM